MKKIILLIIPLLFLTGCQNYRELNELAIATAIEVDKIGNEFHLLVQVANPKNQNDASSANQPQFVTYEAKGNTIQEAFRNIVKESSRKIYGMHVQLLIITENIAKEDLSSMLDFFFRNVEIRKEFYVIVDTTKTDDKLLKVLTPVTNLSSKSIMDTLETNNKFLGISNLVTFNDLMDIYLDDNKELVLPTIYMEGNYEKGKNEEILKETDTETKIFLGNMAVFKAEKLLGYLTKEESITVNLIKNEINDTLITYECAKNKYTTSEITLDKTDIKIDLEKLSVTINIKGTGTIAEYDCNGDLTKEKTINKINDKLNKYIEKTVKESIISINTNYNSDIYNFKDMIYKQDPKYYNKIKNNYYEEVFNKLNYSIKSEIELQGKGNIVGGTYEKFEN